MNLLFQQLKKTHNIDKHQKTKHFLSAWFSFMSSSREFFHKWPTLFTNHERRQTRCRINISFPLHFSTYQFYMFYPLQKLPFCTRNSNRLFLYSGDPFRTILLAFANLKKGCAIKPHQAMQLLEDGKQPSSLFLYFSTNAMYLYKVLRLTAQILANSALFMLPDL